MAEISAGVSTCLIFAQLFHFLFEFFYFPSKRALNMSVVSPAWQNQLAQNVAQCFKGFYDQVDNVSFELRISPILNET